ncbi:MAG: FAD-dependent oxidoreductase [Planctomycetia bacterium]
MQVEVVEPSEAWFSGRVWAISGNKVLVPDGTPIPRTTLARRIYRPTSAQQVASVLQSLPAATPVACVCGGHESSNAPGYASREAVILDLARLKSIEFSSDSEGLLVTVGAGVVFRELVEAVRQRHGALPVGTGPDVGVVGYAVNGGLSGYFSRRLGLLGQRATRMTVVTAAGEVRVLTPQDALFTAMLGAGSALAVVVDITFRVAPEAVVRGGEQRVMLFDTRAQAVAFSRRALRLMKERVLPDESVSMELVVSGTKALVATFICYDTFKGDFAAFVKPWEDLAAGLGLPVVAQGHWSSWFEVAAALWPVILAQKGDPLASLYHAMGTHGMPEDAILDFVCDTVVGEAPLDEAEMSIVEIRALGGAAMAGPRLPSGNCHHAFFLDLITIYDAKGKSAQQRKAIADLTMRVVDKGRAVPGLSIDLSGTHSQPDDAGRSAVAAVIFGDEAMAARVRAQKREVDPHGRFCFHPYAKFL